MLYNDEVHSYDQVTHTLKKSLNIDDKVAFEYAAVVDREGRSALRRGKRDECATLKTKVDSNMTTLAASYQPLVSKVTHHSLVAHQYFAEKLLAWLQKICAANKGLKHVLCKVGFFADANNDNHSVVEKLMLSDSTFWKSVRASL